MAKEPTYTPKEDVVERYKDGSGTVVVAKAGKAIPWSFARALGLVEGDALEASPEADAKDPAKARS